MSWFKLFRVWINLMFILILFVISLIVLTIGIYIAHQAGTLTPENSKAINLFSYLLLFVFACKSAFYGYDAYKEYKGIK